MTVACQKRGPQDAAAHESFRAEVGLARPLWFLEVRQFSPEPFGNLKRKGEQIWRVSSCSFLSGQLSSNTSRTQYSRYAASRLARELILG
jgi:hypothetical protein